MIGVEKAVKITLLSTFCFLNVIDLVQTVPFLRMGIESNPFARDYPQFWFPMKLIIAFGLPIGLYWLDGYLEAKDDEGFTSNLKWFVAFVYLMILFADLFYLSIVLRNAHLLGRF